MGGPEEAVISIDRERVCGIEVLIKSLQEHDQG